ncbi:MAG: hypothetical protein AAF430_16345 [Myxococcota bacterium]
MSGSRLFQLLLAILVGGVAGFGIGHWMGPPGVPERASSSEVSTNLYAATRAALLEPDVLDRALAMRAVGAQLDESNVEEAARAVDELVIPSHSCEVGQFMHARASFDPRGAFEQSLSWTGARKRGVGLHAASYGWAIGGGGLEAVTSAESIPNLEARESAMTGAIRGWARSDDIDGVTTYLARLPEDTGQVRNRMYLMYIAGPLLYDHSADHLMEWAADVPDDAPNNFKAAVYDNTLRQLSNADPKKAIDWYQANEGKPYHEGSLQSLTLGWSRNDPHAALEWVMALPETDERDFAVLRIMKLWLARDQLAAMTWVRDADLKPELAKKIVTLWTPQGRGRRAF